MELKTTWKPLCFLVILLTVTCRGVISQQQDPWIKLNSRPVCFGAKDNQYGSFSVPFGGKIAAIKLVHLSGYVSCRTSSMMWWSFWGCGNFLNVVVTNSSNELILPLSQFIKISDEKSYYLPGYKPFSPDLVLPFFSPYSVSSGQQLRLWYGEDLMDYYETNNGGRVCCDVYALNV